MGHKINNKERLENILKWMKLKHNQIKTYGIQFLEAKLELQLPTLKKKAIFQINNGTP